MIWYMYDMIWYDMISSQRPKIWLMTIIKSITCVLQTIFSVINLKKYFHTFIYFLKYTMFNATFNTMLKKMRSHGGYFHFIISLLFILMFKTHLTYLNNFHMVYLFKNILSWIYICIYKFFYRIERVLLSS